MSNTKFSNAAAGFRKRLSENSPLEGPVKGFNRFSRDMSPATRELVLRARMPEIMAFADDRRLDPAVVAGAVEASMRLGRIPDLGLYGLAGDEALAVKDFVASSILGLEHELRQGLPVIAEDAGKAVKHKGYADHYRKLATNHSQSMDFHTNAAKEANREGRPFTAAKHQGKLAMLKQLHMSHGALADYHDCESDRCSKEAQRTAIPTGAGPTHVDQPTGQPERPAHPTPGSTAAQRQEVPAMNQEQTTSASLSPVMQPIGSAFLRRTPIKSIALRKGDKDRNDEDELRKEQIRDEQRRTRSKSSNGFFQKTQMIEDFIAEAKKDKKDKKDKKKVKAPGKKELGLKSDPDKSNLALANAKMAGLYQQLGHKMDHAEASLCRDAKVKDKWTKKLHKLCLSKGGPCAYQEVVKESLGSPWIRDQGFVDEAAQLTHLWQTCMSGETETTVSKASPTTPEPMVFTINRMIDMAQGRGSIY